MAKYYRQNLTGSTGKPSPPVRPLTGGKLARASRVASVFRSQDRAVLGCRRIVGTLNMRGDDEFVSVHDGSSIPNGGGTYHNFEAERTVQRFRFHLTPGCMLYASIAYIPSGPTEIQNAANPEGGTFSGFGGMGGSVRFEVDWGLSSGTVESSHTVSLPGQHGIIDDGLTTETSTVIDDLEIFDLLRVTTAGPFTPADLQNPATLRAYCQHIEVAVDVIFIGSPRIVDLVLYEAPYAIAMEADDDADQWTAHIFGGGNPDGDAPGLEFAYQRLDEAASDGDPRGGSWHVTDVARAQAQRFGPVLFSWTAYDEAAAVSDTEFTSTRTSDSFVSIILAAGTSSYDADVEGWSFAGAAYARRYSENHAFALSNNGSVPVRVRAYVDWSAASPVGVGYVRVQTAPYSYIDLEVPTSVGTTPQWVTTTGHLRCGKGPGDDSVCQVFKRGNGTDTLNIHAVTVEAIAQEATL